MKKNETKIDVISKTAGLTVLLLGMSGCMDVKYTYKIPESQSDCPTNMIYRDGGASIVDRDNGTSIRDRDGNEVKAYCEEVDCPSGNWAAIPPEMEWHLDKGDNVIANRTCLANP